MKKVDPGWGDPNAPLGTTEWAKSWRCGFQTAVKDLPFSVQSNKRFYDLGREHRAWTLLTDAGGKSFRSFETFCACGPPYGLGHDPAAFLAHLRAEFGDKAVDLETAPIDARRLNGANQHTGPREDSRNDCGNPLAGRKGEYLRAILRAPEVVQDLYRAGLVNQTDAAKMGPKAPSPSFAGFIAEARQELEEMDRPKEPKFEASAKEKGEYRQAIVTFRKEAGKAIRRRLGVKEPTPLDHLRRWWAKASQAERDAFLQEVKP